MTTAVVPPQSPITFVLTTGTDVLVANANDTTVNGNALTLGATDNLDGGAGFDSLVLFGSGTFDLNGLVGFANFEKVEVVNISSTVAKLILKDGTTTDVVTSGIGPSDMVVGGTAVAGSIIGGAGSDDVLVGGDASVTTIDLGDGNDSVEFSGSGGNASITMIDLGDAADGAGSQYVYFEGSAKWNPNVAITAQTGAFRSNQVILDDLIGVSVNTFDLQPTVLTGIDTLRLNGNVTALIDNDTLTGIIQVNGQGTKIIATSAMLDLRGKSVTGTLIHSSNVTGTTFTIDSKATGFQVLGGAGADTLHALGFAFTTLERQAIFATSSIETKRPCLRAFLLPLGAPGDIPPCIRQRPFGIAGDWHGLPRRVRAPHRGARCMSNCMGLIL